jgi:hypothetical protein
MEPLIELHERALGFLSGAALGTPGERDPEFFHTWQRVSLALQKLLRARIPEMAYRDLARYDDRDAAHPMVIYEACRLFYGRPRTEFTFDIADEITLDIALRMIGHATQVVLARIEKRLDDAGNRALARRYSPVWHLDVLADVRRKPKRLLARIAAESRVIDALIDLGSVRTPESARRFAQIVGAALRNVSDTDMRELGSSVLEVAAASLASAAEKS